MAEFAEGDLGTPLNADGTPPHIAAYLKVAAKAVAPIVAKPKITQAGTPVARAPTPEVRQVKPFVIPQSSTDTCNFAALGNDLEDAFVALMEKCSSAICTPPCRPKQLSGSQWQLQHLPLSQLPNPTRMLQHKLLHGQSQMQPPLPLGSRRPRRHLHPKGASKPLHQLQAAPLLNDRQAQASQRSSAALRPQSFLPSLLQRFPVSGRTPLKVCRLASLQCKA